MGKVVQQMAHSSMSQHSKAQDHYHSDDQDQNLYDAYGDKGSWWWWFLEYVWATPFFHSDNQEKMVMLVKRGSRTAIYGQPLFFPSQRTQEPWLLINLIQFPPKWVTSRRPLLRPGTPDTISDRERVHLPYSTNCGDAPGILVILPPAAAIYLIITIHKSHPQSVHPPRGPTPTRRFNFQHARTTISTLPHRSRT